ncbi:MAG: hypothetical protein QOC81_3467 [Thermoanaerobaculia bacterium]|jgi:hypothetical protein|nr:hypothetical protein [Thermoanaerobaculia bacterium]
MKRAAAFSVLVILIAFPLAAQSSAQGSFNFKGTEGLQTIAFDAQGDDRSAQGSFTLAGPTLVSDGDFDQEDPKQTYLAKDFTMKVTVDCMSSIGNRVTMGGTVSDSTVRSMIGRVAMLTVEDNDLNEKDPTDRFVFGSYWEKDITWFPSDAEDKGDAGWNFSWWATDAERKDDVGYKVSRTRQVNCHSFPVAAYDLDPISEGRITVANK